MEGIRTVLNEPLVLLFVILFIGSVAGQAKIKGISLGTSAVLFVAMVFGHFGYEVSGVVQNFGLSLFIVAVGLQAGPRFFKMLRSSGVVFGILGLLTIVSAAGTTLVMSYLFNISPALSVGIMSGALTSTPGLAASLEATGDPLASVGYGIAYPFGVLAVVLFVQLFPKILKVDLMKDLNRRSGPVRHKGSPEVMTIEVTSDQVHRRTLREIGIGKGTSAVISRVIRGDRNIISLSDTVILKGDLLVTVGLPEDLKKIRDSIGRETVYGKENHDHVKLRKVTVDAADVVGRSLREMALRRNYGVTVTRIERGGFEFNQHPGWRLETGDILTVVSSEDRIAEVERLFSRRELEVTNIHILSLSLILLIGVLVGTIPLYIPGLGSMTLGTAGGPLLAALIIGHFGKLGPIRARFFQPSNEVIRDLGLVLFLAGAGTTAGAGLVEVLAEEGLQLLAAGVVITIVPLLLVFLAAKKLFHLSMLHSLGAICGGMTSTPGLGALNQIVDSEDPSIAYAAAYPFALIFIAFVSQLLVLLL